MEFNSFAESTIVQQLQRGAVEAMHADGSIEVRLAAGNIQCDVLCTAAGPLSVAKDDAVLVVMPSADSERGVVLGRIGVAMTEQAATTPGVVNETPTELLLEAKESLTLRVGEGSITIRADGKILIKGKDLVSHAQRVNRIRGGSVAIN